MAMKLYLCEMDIFDEGPLKGVEQWLSSASQVEARKAAESMLPGQRITGVYCNKAKK